MLHRSGFTLLESLLYVATASIVLFAVSGFALAMMDARVKHSTIAEVEQQSIQVKSVLTHLIRNAVDVTAPASSSTGTTLEVDVVDPLRDPVVVSLQGSTLQISEGSPAVVTNLTSETVIISDFEVINTAAIDTSDVIQINFTISRANTSNRNPYSYSEDVSFTVPINPNTAL